MDKIKELRENIDLLDDQIMNRLEERFKLVEMIGKVKKENKLEVTDSNRESEILKNSEKFSYSKIIKEIYKVIFNESKKIQG